MPYRPGDRFGRYELVSRLGHGGMAETWKARLLGAAGVTKSVLIKKILPAFADDQAFISMFINEARISASLSHGNIAQVHDFGEVGGEYFLAMEFVHGKPLDRLIQRAHKAGLFALPTQVATFIALEMCRGLHYAHTRTDDSGRPLGLVHRDISPDNVLISYEGQIKIVDFGIAKARASARGLQTAPGVVKGKYLFFSPEQAHGDEVDARTDVWATGIVLYEMLTGRLPVEGPEHSALPKLIHGLFPRPSDLRRDLPPRLDNILMRALALKPEERFQSSHAFEEALAGFLYSSTPRFSGMTLSYLLQELYREELTQEGRPVKVPASFLDDLEQWKIPPTGPVDLETELKTRPVARKAVPAAASRMKASPQKAAPPAASRARPQPQTDPAHQEGADTLDMPALDLDAQDTAKTLDLPAVTTDSVRALAYPSTRQVLRQRRQRTVLALVAMLVVGTATALLILRSDWLLSKLLPVISPPPPQAPTPVAVPPPPSAIPPAPPVAPPTSASRTEPEAPPPEASQSGNSAVGLLAADAKRLLDRGEYAEAALTVSRCIELDPANSQCRMLQTSVLSHLEHNSQEQEQQRARNRKRTDTSPESSEELEFEP